jgi:hypothetical protein
MYLLIQNKLVYTTHITKATRRQLASIVNQIAGVVMHKDGVTSGGLLAGKAAHALFYGHLYHCFGSESYF